MTIYTYKVCIRNSSKVFYTFFIFQIWNKKNMNIVCTSIYMSNANFVFLPKKISRDTYVLTHYGLYHALEYENNSISRICNLLCKLPVTIMFSSIISMHLSLSRFVARICLPMGWTPWPAGDSHKIRRIRIRITSRSSCLVTIIRDGVVASIVVFS